MSSVLSEIARRNEHANLKRRVTSCTSVPRVGELGLDRSGVRERSDEQQLRDEDVLQEKNINQATLNTKDKTMKRGKVKGGRGEGGGRERKEGLLQFEIKQVAVYLVVDVGVILLLAQVQTWDVHGRVDDASSAAVQVLVQVI